MELDLEKSPEKDTCDVDDEAPHTDGEQRGRDEKRRRALAQDPKCGSRRAAEDHEVRRDSQGKLTSSFIPSTGCFPKFASKRSFHTHIENSLTATLTTVETMNPKSARKP